MRDAAPLTVSTISSPYGAAQTAPAIAFGGSDYLVAWQDLRDGPWGIYAARVSPGGTMRDGNGFAVVPTPQDGLGAPRVASDGAAWLVAYQSQSGAAIGAARVSAAGAPLDAGGFAVAATTPLYGVALAYDGAQYLAAWSAKDAGGDYQLAASQITSGGVAGMAAPFVTAQGGSWGPYLAAGGGHVLAAWNDGRAGGTTVYAAAVAAGVASGTGVVVPSEPASEDAPAVDFDGTSFFAVWSDGRTGGPNIYGERLSITGGAVGPAAPVSTSPTSQTSPAVAWNGSEHLVVWTAATGLFGRRVDAAGVPLETSDISIAPGGFGARVSAIGSTFLVVWEALGSGSQARARRVSAAGVVLDNADLTLSPAGASVNGPAVAGNATSALVAWWSSGPPLGVRVDGTGTVLDPMGLALPSKPSMLALSVASSGTDWLVAGRTIGAGGNGVQGFRVSASGAVLDATPFVVGAEATGDVYDDPVAAFDGTNYVVAWTNDHYDSSFTNTGESILAASVAPGGAGVASALVESQSGSGRGPKPVIAAGGGAALVAYGVAANVSGLGVARVRARVWAENPPAGTCGTSGDCASGNCVGGFCCDTVCDGACVACSVAAGAAVNGHCGPIADGTSCFAYSDACVTAAACSSGVCAATLHKTCSASDVCHSAGMCDPSSGQCSNPAKADGTQCDDGDACTMGDVCQSGSCRGAPLTCAMSSCHSGACDPSTGTCSGAALPDGTGCDDGDPCTQSDACARKTRVHLDDGIFVVAGLVGIAAILLNEGLAERWHVGSDGHDYFWPSGNPRSTLGASPSAGARRSRRGFRCSHRSSVPACSRARGGGGGHAWCSRPCSP